MANGVMPQRDVVFVAFLPVASCLDHVLLVCLCIALVKYQVGSAPHEGWCASLVYVHGFLVCFLCGLTWSI